MLEEAVARVPLPIFSYLIMPNHWHFVVRPTSGSELSEFLSVVDARSYNALARSSPHRRNGAPLSGPSGFLVGDLKNAGLLTSPTKAENTGIQLT